MHTHSRFWIRRVVSADRILSLISAALKDLGPYVQRSK